MTWNQILSKHFCSSHLALILPNQSGSTSKHCQDNKRLMSRVSSLEAISIGYCGRPKNVPHTNLKVIYVKSLEPKHAFLCGKGIFCKCGLLTILRCDNSGLFRKPSNLRANVLITKRWSFETERWELKKGGGKVTLESEIGMMPSQVKKWWSYQKLDETRNEISTVTRRGGSLLKAWCQTFDLPSVRRHIYVF